MLEPAVISLSSESCSLRCRRRPWPAVEILIPVYLMVHYFLTYIDMRPKLAKTQIRPYCTIKDTVLGQTKIVSLCPISARMFANLEVK